MASSGADGGPNSQYPEPSPGFPQPTPPNNATGHTAAHAQTQIVSIWSDRLQLTSVLATFFTSIDSFLFSLSTNQRDTSPTGNLTTACMAGALIFHAAGAILAYIGSFVLIRYKLQQVEDPPLVMHSAPPSISLPLAAQHLHAQSHHAHASHDSEKLHHSIRKHTVGNPQTRPHPSNSGFPSLPAFAPVHTANSSNAPDHPVLSRSTSFLGNMFNTTFLSPHIGVDRVYPFSRVTNLRKRPTGLTREPDVEDKTDQNPEALTRLLTRCQHTCSLFVLIGFLLLITGVVAFAWAVLDRPSIVRYPTQMVPNGLNVLLFILEDVEHDLFIVQKSFISGGFLPLAAFTLLARLPDEGTSVPLPTCTSHRCADGPKRESGPTRRGHLRDQNIR
ncbi:hypothetical protein OF83DRAFT_1172220 [Amylostereum chailletii]|nr:hypothetical protein OF83DRAFT_1172220 [Amylostereum chailletii]